MTGSTLTFGQLIERGSLVVNDGYRTKASELGHPGIPILRVAEIGDGVIEPSYGDHVREEYRATIGAKLSQPGDVLLTTKGTVGRRAIVPPGLPQFAYSPQLCFFRPTDRSVDGRWLYYWLGGAEFWEQAAGVATQTDMAPYISLRDLRAIRVSLPPRPEQRGIAATLGALDDKIESNRRFVALIPRLIRVCVEQVLAETGLRVPVSSLARFVNGGAYTKGASGTGRMVLRIAELNGEPGASTVYSEIEVPDDQTARAGDILMSWSGSLGVYRWFRDEAVVNQHIFKVIPIGYPAWLVFDRLDAVMPVFRGVAADKATTMGHIQRGHLDSTSVEIPAAAGIERLTPALDALWDRLLLAERENLKLAALRDALLPELLSGRIRVPEAADVVASATKGESSAQD